MKKHLSILVLALACGIAPATAQKLSPKADILLTKRNSTTVGRQGTAASPALPSSIRAFVSINDDSALDRMQALGAKVLNTFETGVATVEIPVDALEAVSRIAEVDYVEMGASVNMLMDTARINGNVELAHSNALDELPSAFTGKGVVIGVIDNGLEYNHAAFYTSDGSECRLKAVWDQNGMGKAPDLFGYGAEYLKLEEMKAAKCDKRNTYHGSHTTGIAAAGDKRSKYYGVAPDAEIVYVSFDETSVDIANGIKYIFDYADRVGKPCVINMSLGSHEGPHNGESYLDQIIDAYTGPGRVVVGACGNEAISNLHVHKKFTDGDTFLKTMFTPLKNSSYSKTHIVNAWGTKGSAFKVKAVVVDALKGRVVSESPAYDTSNPHQESVIKVFYIDDHGADANVVIKGVTDPISGMPSAEIDISTGSIGSGRLLGLVVEGEPDAEVHMWNLAQNNFTSNGLSAWTDGDTNYSVGEIGGTAKRIITVGSYDNRSTVAWNDNTMSIAPGMNPLHRSDFSSMGPTADGRLAPHVLAPGNPVIAACNKFGFTLGPLSEYTSEITDGYGSDDSKYYYAYDQGTSMASPFVAGTVALLLQANPELTPEEAREALMSTATTADYMGELPNCAYGAGRVNAYEAIKHVLGITAVNEIATDGATLKAWIEPGSRTVCLSSDAPEGEKVEVYDITGRLVASVVAQRLTQLDASAWGNGVFIVRGETVSHKLAI